MAVLYISEYATISIPNAPIAAEPSIITQTLAIGVEVKSAAFNSQTRYVRIHTDAICSIAFGASPTAAITSMRLAAPQTEYFSVTPGHKVSVISNT
jgi:hypothetical protein